MRKLLCSLGVGPSAELLALSGETFRTYAERHGYELALHDSVVATERPPAWSKVQILRAALEEYDVVLWIDADAAIVDASTDILDGLHRRSVLGLVAHRYDGQQIPNSGVMVLRRSRAARRFLADVWNESAYVDHKWWENAAFLHVLGYELEPTVRLLRPARIMRRVQFLDVAWNSIAEDTSERARVRHYPGRSQQYRLEHLRADLAALRASAEIA